MHQLTHGRAGRAAGFTLLEAMVALAIFGLLLGIGIPNMNKWILANKAASATEMYAEGLRLARLQALTHNASSRLLLTENQANGQMNWQVDLCFPQPGTPCDGSNGNWSTVSAAAADDPEGNSGYQSVFRSAAGLPASTMLAPTIEPEGSAGVYFNARGWVDTAIDQRLTRIQLDPTSAYTGQLRASAVVVTLAGLAVKCDPDVAANDSRACP